MKKASLVLKEMPGGVISSPAKKEKKRGGLAWFWNKITSPFSGTTESEVLEKPAASSREKTRGALFWLWDTIKSPFVAGAEDVDAAITNKIAELGDLENPAEGLSSTASSAGKALDGAGSLSEEAGTLGQQFDELASRVAARVGAEASPWIGKAIVVATAAGVIATGALAAHHFINATGSFKTPYGGPIASGINAHPAGPNNVANSPMGNIASGVNTVAGNNTSTAQSARTSNTGKTVAPNVPTPASGQAPKLGSLAMPSGGSFGGGSPVGNMGAAPQYAGQAAQEAAAAKNSIAWAPQAVPTAMSARSGAITGTMGFRGGKAFNSGRSLGALRTAVGYNAAMNGAGYSADAQNAINQFDNQMTSGGGVSQGGITTGSADSANSIGGNTPSMMGSGSGSGSGYGTSTPGDIAQVCSADQLSKGWASNGTTCVNMMGGGGGQQSTPWQSLLTVLNILLGIAAIINILVALFSMLGNNPFLSWMKGLAGALVIVSLALGAIVMGFANTVTQMGGASQGQMLMMSSIGNEIAAGLAYWSYTSPSWWIAGGAIVLSLMSSLGTLLGS